MSTWRMDEVLPHQVTSQGSKRRISVATPSLDGFDKLSSKPQEMNAKVQPLQSPRGLLLQSPHGHQVGLTKKDDEAVSVEAQSLSRVSRSLWVVSRFSNVMVFCLLLCSSAILVQFGYYLGRTSTQTSRPANTRTELSLSITRGMDNERDSSSSSVDEPPLLKSEVDAIGSKLDGTVFEDDDKESNKVSRDRDAPATAAKRETSASLPSQSPSSWLKMEPTVHLVQNPLPCITRGSNFDTDVSRDRGILVSIHNKAIAMGLSLIRELRCHGNNELIQVYHCFSTELSIENQQLLVRFDDRLEIIDVCQAMVNDGRLSRSLALKFQSYWIKPLAVIHTEIRHVLLLDADDVLLSDPSLLRHQSKRYQTTGTMFFYDRVTNCNGFFNKDNYLKHLIKRFHYQSFGITGPIGPSIQLQSSWAYTHKTCHEMDSSMVFIDKTQSGQAMKVLWWLITIERFHFNFSWGDKESFWLAYELAHQPYSFSPWGVSVVSHTGYEDIIQHSDTLCGSIAQFVPMDEDEEREVLLSTTPTLLYVNGRALLEPFPQGLENRNARANVMHNANPTHVTPRQIRSSGKKSANPMKYPHECLVGLGSTPLPDHFKRILLQRRIFFMGITTNFTEVLERCTL